VFSNTIWTLAGWSTTRWAGWTLRVTAMTLLMPLVVMAASRGNVARSTPTRVMSENPSRRPPMSKVRPAATKAEPRVVRMSRMRVNDVVRSLSVCRSARIPFSVPTQE
jgi:hypothetical protein